MRNTNARNTKKAQRSLHGSGMKTATNGLKTTTGSGSRPVLRGLLWSGLLLIFLPAAPQAQQTGQRSTQQIRQEQPQVLGLDSILSGIRQNNPMLEGYDYKIKAMNAYAEGARSWMAPMLGAGTFMTPYPWQNTMSSGDKGMLMLSAVQEIPNPAKLRARENYLESKAAIQAAGQDYTYNQLRAEARKLFYEWVVLEKKKKILEENREIMETMLKLARIRYPYNQAGLGSIYKAEGRLQEVENSLLETGNRIIEKNIGLNALMNIPRDTRYRIDTAVQLLATPALAASDTAYLLQSRSDLIGMERSIESKQLAVELDRMERKPEFSLRFEHMLPYGGTMPNTYTLMGMISIPIAPWASKKYKSTIKGRQLELRAMEKERQAALVEAQGLISGIARNIRSLRQQLENYRNKIIPALRKNYEVTMLAYEQNQEELPAVIDAWEALNMARQEQLNKLEAYYLKVVEYEKQVEK